MYVMLFWERCFGNTAVSRVIVPKTNMYDKRTNMLCRVTYMLPLVFSALAASPPPRMPNFRLGGLFATHRVGALMAAVMAVQEINNSTEFLPLHTIRFAVQDSACEAIQTLLVANHLVQTSFAGLGAAAIVGATCSDAAKAAALYLSSSGYSIPQLSASSTSAVLSDSNAFAYFSRTAPSDAWQSSALVDVVQNLLGVERIATVNSEDSYGAAGMAQFRKFAGLRSMSILASTSAEVLLGVL